MNIRTATCCIILCRKIMDDVRHRRQVWKLMSERSSGGSGSGAFISRNITQTVPETTDAEGMVLKVRDMPCTEA